MAAWQLLPIWQQFHWHCMSITKTLAARQGPCPFFVLLLPWQTLCQFEHAKRFYCCLWTLGKTPCLPPVTSSWYPRDSMSKLWTPRRADFCAHFGQILAHNSILHATTTRQVVNFYECKWRVFLPTDSQSEPDNAVVSNSVCAPQLAMTIARPAAGCRLQAISFSLSPVVDWSYVKIYCQINGDLYVDYNVRFIRRYTTRNKRAMVLKHFKWLN